MVVLAVIALLIFINAIYVAAEFSTVSSRRSRLSRLAEEGSQAADGLLSIVGNSHKLDDYVASCQIGITVSSLVLGYYGQAQLSSLFLPLLDKFGNFNDAVANSISATLVLIVLTISQVLLGELVPKNIGIQYPERLAVLTSVPMQWSSWLFRPLIWLFNGSGQLLMRLFRLHPDSEHIHIHSPEEIGMLVEESGEAGVIAREERRLLRNTLLLRESRIHQVMIPRIRMVAASKDTPLKELFLRVADSQFSRLPIYDNTVDNIIGVIHLKELLKLAFAPDIEISLQDLLHPVAYVPENTPVKTVFSMLQRQRMHVAIILGEFGGTEGMVTLEDLIEEIFGDIRDEFDTLGLPIQILPGEQLLINGDVQVEQLNEWLDLDIQDEDLDTIGGLILNSFGEVPKPGDSIEISGILFTVFQMEGRGISRLKMKANAEQIHHIRKEVLG